MKDSAQWSMKKRIASLLVALTHWGTDLSKKIVSLAFLSYKHWFVIRAFGFIYLMW